MQCAFATFLMLNDNYLPGCLVLAGGLRRQKVSSPLIVLVTEEVSPQARQALAELYDYVVEVPRIYVPHIRRQERQDRPYYFTRIQVLRLGPDGDLGFEFDRVVVIDADVLPISNYEALLEIDAPAGVLNEHKSHFAETDEGGQYVIPPEAAEGRWIWHRIYADCLHGQLVPKHISDRPGHDPKNMGFNGSLFVMKPSMAEYRSILKDLERPSVMRLVGDQFDWPDMQYLTMRWSGQWRNLDVRYSALNGYPSLDVLYGTHFAGFKPWYFQRPKAMERYVRYPDFQLWFSRFEELMVAYPQLLKLGKLKRLREAISKVRQ
jgi:alpha-N-acetylglucosamine transferase